MPKKHTHFVFQVLATLTIAVEIEQVGNGQFCYFLGLSCNAEGHEYSVASTAVLKVLLIYSNGVPINSCLLHIYMAAVRIIVYTGTVVLRHRI